MAKASVKETKTTVHKFEIEGTVKADSMSIETEDSGVKLLEDILRKFNNETVKIVITDKQEEEI